MPSFERRVIDKTWHKGSIHEPAPDGDYSKTRDGMADNYTYIREDIKSTADIRDPATTQVLSDLEREYGIKTDENLSEATRISLLKVQRYKKKTTAQPDELERRLQNAGFDLFVYNNSPEGPAIDPAIVISQNFQMQAMEGTNYYAGNTLAYAGNIGGYWLVNGRIFGQLPAYLGAGTMWADNTTSTAGYFNNLDQEETVYPTPADPDRWPFVFFVGGVADFNLDGSISGIAQGVVPSTERKSLEDIILKFKPLFTWCALIVNFT